MLDDAQIRAREDAGPSNADGRRSQGRSRTGTDRRAAGAIGRKIGCRWASRNSTPKGTWARRRLTWQRRSPNWRSSRRLINIAAFDKDAYTRLAKTGAVSERQGLQAAATADQQAAVVAAAKRRVEAAQGALTTAQASLANPGIRESQVALVRKQIAEQEAEVASAAAQTQQARAQLAEAEDEPPGPDREGALHRNRGDARGRAGRSGHGGNRHHHAAGFDQGVPARICAGRPDRQGEGGAGGARLSRLNPKQTRSTLMFRASIPQATFTPENTYFRDDRVKQVVGLKLQLKGRLWIRQAGHARRRRSSGARRHVAEGQEPMITATAGSSGGRAARPQRRASSRH